MLSLHVWRLAAVVIAAADIWCRDEAALLQQQRSIVPAPLRARADRAAASGSATTQAAKALPTLQLLEMQLEAFPDAVLLRKIKTPWGEVAAVWLALGALSPCLLCMVYACCRSSSREQEDEYKINFTLAHSTTGEILSEKEEEADRRLHMTTIQEARRTYMERMTTWFTSEDGEPTDRGVNGSESGCDSNGTRPVSVLRESQEPRSASIANRLSPTTLADGSRPGSRPGSLSVPSTPAGSSARPEIKKLSLSATRVPGSPDDRQKSRLSPSTGNEGQQVTKIKTDLPGSPGDRRRSRPSPRQEGSRLSPRQDGLRLSPRQDGSLMSPRQDGQQEVSRKSALKGSPRSPRPSFRDSEARRGRVSFRPALVSDLEEHRAS